MVLNPLLEQKVVGIWLRVTETDVTDYISQKGSEILTKESQLNVLTEEATKLRKGKTTLVNLRIEGELNKEALPNSLSRWRGGSLK